MELMRILRKMTGVEMIHKTFSYFTDSAYRFRVHKALGLYDKMPDEEYLCRLFQATTGRRLNLENPETFSEKLQWLKLYNRRSQYTTMVDKLAVKEYVAKKIGKHYVIPTLGVWNRFDEIDFRQLPKQFVLKCTHDSGGGQSARIDQFGTLKKNNKNLIDALGTTIISFHVNGHTKMSQHVLSQNHILKRKVP